MLRILTVRQPWASLIVMGHKPVENRTWRTDYRGDVAIVAGRAIDIGDRAIEGVQRCLAPMIDRKAAEEAIFSLPRGGIIGLAELWDEKPTMDSWWFTGPNGLLLRNPRRLKALLPFRGSLVLGKATVQLEQYIRAQL